MGYYTQQRMSKRGGKIRLREAMTLLELVIAMAMITIIFAAVLPQFAIVRSSWDSKQGIAEALQNGRVLMDHINRNLSKAVRITAVSEYLDTDGYIEFEDNDGNTFKYEYVAGENNNYVEFGPQPGTLSDLAGPVSSLKFTCYDACDLDTPLSPVTDVNVIRTVRVDATVTNSGSIGQNKTFTTWVYLRTNGNTNGLVGCWKLDETSGFTAADSSGRGHDGTLTNMAGNEWTTGQINGALAFGGTDDLVQVAGLSNCLGTDYSVSWWAKPNQIALKEMILLGNDYSTHDFEYYQYSANLRVRADAGIDYDIEVNNVFVAGQWVHICGVGDSNGTRVYVDGTLAGSTSVKKNTTSGYNLHIGAYPTGEWDFNGVIDDVCIYNRALSAEEIAEMANVLRYRGFAEAKAGPYSPVITISRPSPTNAGDLLIAAVATDGDTSSVIAAPGGWTLIDPGAYNGEVTLAAWWKIAGASEPASYQFTWWGSSKDAYGWIMRFTGHNSTNPINTYSTYGESSSTPTSPAVTTTVNNCLILRLGAFDDDGIVVDSPGLASHTAITMDESRSTEVSVTYLGLGANKVVSDSNFITIPKPSGTSSGNFLIAAVATDGNTGSSFSTPSVWSRYSHGAPSNLGVTLGIWCKTAGASEPASYTFSWSASVPERAYGWIMRFTGSSIVGQAFTSGNSSSPTSPAVTPSGPFGGSILILRLGAFDEDGLRCRLRWRWIQASASRYFQRHLQLFTHRQQKLCDCDNPAMDGCL
jgi:type II secretory pathway pseudopilin PulG